MNRSAMWVSTRLKFAKGCAEQQPTRLPPVALHVLLLYLLYLRLTKDSQVRVDSHCPIHVFLKSTVRILQLLLKEDPD